MSEHELALRLYDALKEHGESGHFCEEALGMTAVCLDGYYDLEAVANRLLEVIAAKKEGA